MLCFAHSTHTTTNSVRGLLLAKRSIASFSLLRRTGFCHRLSHFDFLLRLKAATGACAAWRALCGAGCCTALLRMRPRSRSTKLTVVSNAYNPPIVDSFQFVICCKSSFDISFSGSLMSFILEICQSVENISVIGRFPIFFFIHFSSKFLPFSSTVQGW